MRLSRSYKVFICLSLQIILNILCAECSWFSTIPSEDYSGLNVTKYDPSFKNKVLSRKKRYLLFPEGSNFVITIALVKRMVSLYPDSWNQNNEYDMAWKLPSDPTFIRRTTFGHRLPRPKKPMSRSGRDRRDLYGSMEALLERIGIDGRTCVMRTICEVKHILAPRGTSLAQDLFRILFTLYTGEDEVDRSHLKEYHKASKHDDCEEKYANGCPISLLTLLLSFDPRANLIP